ncbi:hypothetical protein [Allomuricauda sp. SCSIO 65647]|uniref:hypothetical protein n=1 Tax=Allomuricauda sp. SCSIO 65647 TaxID=2908843 RepID=UPI001F17671E|nr:hypothetical protein [Muricauda sp. SCSIO 65647]UJH67194.1 hypothetical protein L0P89_14735 [Muricauda sp. SCSIO 65647]
MRFFLLIALFWMGTAARGQTVLRWSDLTEGISWQQPSSKAVFPGFQKATFSPKMKALHGKQVIITGYILVLGGEQSVYILSKNPMASCFFCGNGGPETMMDLRFGQKPSFVMDELLSVEGTFYLNGNNPNACYYRIENADALRLK